MARNRSRRAFKRGPKNYVWMTLLIGNVLVADGAIGGNNIVQTSDWAGDFGFERSTLLTVRGWLSFAGQGVTALSVFALIAKIGDSEPDADIGPSLVASYTDNDILWTGGFNAQVESGDGPGAERHYRENIHIKVKRKMTVGDNIALFITPVGDPVIFSCVLRGLVDKG